MTPGERKSGKNNDSWFDVEVKRFGEDEPYIDPDPGIPEIPGKEQRVRELEAIKTVFGDNVPPISSTKSLTGHSLGAAGVQEAIYSLIMMKNDFICASANIQQLDPAANDLPIQRERKDNAGLRTVMSNSFGFGGTNASLIFQRFED